MVPRRTVPCFLTATCLILVLFVTSVQSDTQAVAQITADDIPVANPSSASLSLQLESYAGGLNQPVGIVSAGDYRLFVLERAGRVRVVQRDGVVLGTPFLDISDRVDASSKEEGLLGLVFHPRYHENGRFYVNYTNTTGGARRTRISSFQVSSDQNVANVDSENTLLTVDQPESNHNAGKILFGPDGYLYVPLGDGGGGGDPNNNGQNGARLLGKISRIDVDSGPGSAPDCMGLGSGDYTIPASNPFVDGPNGTCDEIWAFGLRNPWQSSFDSLTGDLFIADVGQNKIEEVNLQPADSIGGENYGWSCFEGSAEYPATLAECDLPSAYTFPIFEYPHGGNGGCSVTGGYIYRGQRYPSLYGHYFLTDYCTGRFWDLVQLPDESWQATAHDDVFLPGKATLRQGNTAFGQRCDGELFVANIDLGKVYHLAGSPGLSRNPDTSLQGPALDPSHWVYLPRIAISNCQ